MPVQFTEIEFIKSSPDIKSCPESNMPEYAFVGRSNVGKSSLINYLTNRNKLAKTSSVPGKTRLINHFLIDNRWYLVDLPGYGYAKISKKEREKFIGLIRNYLLHRPNLTCLFILIDSRHNPQMNDVEFIRWTGENQIPIALVFTKSDKLKPKDLSENIESYKDHLLREWESLPPVFITSTVNNLGRDEILTFIEDTNRKLSY